MYVLLDTCDYDPGPYSVTFSAGMKSASFTVNITDDDVFESIEIFNLVIDHSSFPNRIERNNQYHTEVSIIDDEERKKLM